jgi:hypothetical protein
MVTGRPVDRLLSKPCLIPRNLKYMRSFGEAYPEEAFVQQVAAQMPWFHNCLILCRRKSRVIVEYTLRRSTSPLGVSTYELTRALPASLQSPLPIVEDIEAELAAVKPLADEETQTSPRESKGRPSNKKRRSPRSQKNP